jgi:hypothetical protein
MKKLLIGFAATAVLVCAATAGAVAEKVFRLGIGDVVFIRGSNISCSVANPYKQMVCFKRNKTGHAKPGTYGTTASDRFAAIVRFKSDGSPVIVDKKDNR